MKRRILKKSVDGFLKAVFNWGVAGRKPVKKEKKMSTNIGPTDASLPGCKTYCASTDSGIVTVTAGNLREALAKMRDIPAHVTTATGWVRWVAQRDGYGTLFAGDVLLARVAR